MLCSCGRTVQVVDGAAPIVCECSRVHGREGIDLRALVRRVDAIERAHMAASSTDALTLECVVVKVPIDSPANLEAGYVTIRIANLNPQEHARLKMSHYGSTTLRLILP